MLLESIIKMFNNSVSVTIFILSCSLHMIFERFNAHT